MSARGHRIMFLRCRSVCSSRNGRGCSVVQRARTSASGSGGIPSEVKSSPNVWQETCIDAFGDSGQPAGEVGGLPVCWPVCGQWRDFFPGDCAELAEHFTYIPDHVTWHGYAPRREGVE